MTRRVVTPKASTDPKPKPFPDFNQVNAIVALLAAAAPLVTFFTALSDLTKIAVTFAALAIVAVSYLYARSRSDDINHQFFQVTIGGLTILLAILAIQQTTIDPPPPPYSGPPPTYYARVTVFIDAVSDGVMSADERFAPDVPVSSRDPLGAQNARKTDINGTALLPFGSPGEVSLGVCGVYQTHAILREHTSPQLALQITIGIPNAEFERCRRI